MCKTILNQLVLSGDESIGKKVTIYPGSDKSIKGKISSVNFENEEAIIEVNGGTIPVSLNAKAQEDW